MELKVDMPSLAGQDIDPETFEIKPHVVGVSFDWQAAQAAYDRAEEGETVSIPLELEQPAESTESLEGKLFADLLGEGTTQVSGSANRKHNVKLSAEACNEKILLPGEELSYNSTTGSRTADKGYKSAQEAIARLNGQPSGAYTYVPPAGPAPTAPPVPQPPKEKPKKGGLFRFFKK